MTAKPLSPGLWLIGIGPGNLEHMTDRAKKVARACEKRYLEGYTAVIPASQEELLDGVIGDWERLMRPSVESPEAILKEAREYPVAILVVGDPMQATTHIDLEARCAEQGIGFEVVPGMSATTMAVSLSGMQSYRFGRQVTLPYQYGNYLPTSPLEMIYSNYNMDLHTLVLLDLDPNGMGFDPPKPMQPDEAVRTLEEMAKRIEDKDGDQMYPDAPVQDWRGILISDIGTQNEKVTTGSLGEISSLGDGWVHTLILPASMSDNEKDAFERRRPR